MVRHVASPPNDPGLPPRAPRDWPGWIGVGVGVLAARLPWALQRRLGVGIGRLLKYAMPPRRRAARRNLALCLPELDDAARETLLDRSFDALGVGVFEFARAWWGSVAPMRGAVEIQGLEHLEALRAQGRGILLVSGHFTTLELCGRLLCDHLQLAGMYRLHDSPAMEWAVKRGRLRYASAMYTQDALRPVVKLLKSGGALWYAPDQDMRGKDTVFAPFFGMPAATITATHQLARLTGCAVVPFFHRREGDRYVLRVGAPLQEFPTADATADTARVNAAIEAMVREAPAQYLWIHRRFKRQPDGRSPY
ncbi:LpxL/LpxP family Kdo(2)-lipid IV(A) lauroyl/palmitoleoyl acyltransferase [Coralloluteibacterium stylophorae]|uniref:Lipid A biosynthesis acyltransferase n=1 Tax=Coralloluteibacterium stylophorae TaxID=1776034 RepID=A0A8J7VUR6_9GAMM|nr:LpxL/LpxP family Kdo(2)-lipid IV(A) lauroyl/palmitoleoyl acyltransferase [Coralloluteibacterium stylophorae]MBS7458499.1 LpxL/LpxP family Kdo(2)-lipid IV(A) lauroyl/palmitoleoyl acyltransferase [Coralloluteibacterium stylophorae]